MVFKQSSVSEEKSVSATTDGLAARNHASLSSHTLRHFSRGKLAVAMAVATLSLAACSSSDDSDDMGPDGSGSGSVPEGSFMVAMNDGQAAGSVTVFTPDIATPARTLATGANQGIISGADGTLYQNSDAAGSTGIRVFGKGAERADNDSFGNSDRMIGNAPGKGLFELSAMSLLASCDVTDAEADLKLYSVTAGEQAGPVSQINLPASCWDGTYVEADDRMYLALTDGTLAIIDEVTALNLFSTADDAPLALGEDALDRRISIVGTDGVKQSVNFHGVSVESGQVLVSDVGSADSPTDGALYVINDTGVLDGEQSIEAVAGPATMLGNPVDVVLSDGFAFVAEKSNDAILVFDAISALQGDVAPDFIESFTKPESIASVSGAELTTDASDIGTNDVVSRLLISQNPGPQQQGAEAVDNSAVGRVRLIDEPAAGEAEVDDESVSLAMTAGDPGSESFVTLENIQLDASGNGYAVYDVTDGTSVSDRGVMVINSLARREGTAVNLNTLDRLIEGAESGLTSPKGIELVAQQGAMIIADTGSDSVSASLVVFSTAAGSSALPVFTVLDTGNGAIWDTDYDPANDRLYAAGTAGDILVYDDFFASGAAATPTRSIRPAAAGMTSNLHGIAHDAQTDTLLVTDVGSAASPVDGVFYVIENASTVSGEITPKASISGSESLLGNPVDIAFDGTNAYIAEKSNDRVLIYRDVLSLEGALDMAASEAVVVLKPESVSLAQ